MYFNCEHLLFVNIVKEKQNNRGFYKKKFVFFFKLNENQILLEASF